MKAGDVLLEDAVIVILQRRPELADALALGGWRVHGIGGYVPPGSPARHHTRALTATPELLLAGGRLPSELPRGIELMSRVNG